MRTLSLTLVALACFGVIAPAVAADAPAPAVSPVTDPAALKTEVAELITKAESWLWTQQQENGAFAPVPKFAVGITALAVDERRGATAAPISMSKVLSTAAASSMVTWRMVRTSGFMVVSQSCSGFISPRPL